MRKPVRIPIVLQKGCSSSLDLLNAVPALKKECEKKGYVSEFLEISAEEINMLDFAEGEVVLVLAFSQFFLNKTLTQLARCGAHPLVLGVSPKKDNCSYISFDRAKAVTTLLTYFEQCGRAKTALFGINPLSVSDSHRKEAFVTHKGEAAQNDIFYNNGSLITAADEFCKAAKKYDSVICANDLAAVVLAMRMNEQHIKIPEDIFVAGSGNTAISRFATPSLTSINLEYAQVGKMALPLYEFLNKMPHGVFAKVTVDGTVFPRASTACIEPRDTASEQTASVGTDVAQGAKFNFVNDKNVIEIDAINQMIGGCDSVDLAALRELQKGKNYEDTAYMLHIGVSTLRYRMNKICRVSGVENKNELMRRLNFYGINFDKE